MVPPSKIETRPASRSFRTCSTEAFPSAGSRRWLQCHLCRRDSQRQHPPGRGLHQWPVSISPIGELPSLRAPPRVTQTTPGGRRVCPGSQAPNMGVVSWPGCALPGLMGWEPAGFLSRRLSGGRALSILSCEQPRAGCEQCPLCPSGALFIKPDRRSAQDSPGTWPKACLCVALGLRMLLIFLKGYKSKNKRAKKSM